MKKKWKKWKKWINIENVGREAGSYTHWYNSRSLKFPAGGSIQSHPLNNIPIAFAAFTIKDDIRNMVCMCAVGGPPQSLHTQR